MDAFDLLHQWWRKREEMSQKGPQVKGKWCPFQADMLSGYINLNVNSFVYDYFLKVAKLI